MRAVVRSLDDLHAFADRCAREGVLDGKPMTVSIRKFHRPRTVDQNKKLHAMFRDLAEHTGYSESNIKDYFKAEFGPTMALNLPKIDDTADYGPVNVPKGTSRYTVQEMSAMVERVYQVGAECGCVFSEEGE